MLDKELVAFAKKSIDDKSKRVQSEINRKSHEKLLESSRNKKSAKIKIISNNGKILRELSDKISQYRVYVGIPESKNIREEREGENKPEISEEKIPVSNADIAFLMENGTARGVPPRPFMEPSIMSISDELVKWNIKAFKNIINGNIPEAERCLKTNGMRASKKVQRFIRDYPENGFAPNKRSTIEAFARKHNQSPNEVFKKPLIDTGQLIQSITYVADFPSMNIDDSTSDSETIVNVSRYESDKIASKIQSLKD